ncbi:hypothetical protein QNH10_05965 [Sporosarcina thermotolerans]|uniref:hypothetical protein n=1 Tax=Sporosarcina thermotolerans TaxID=633404 RepID=UPI0024BC873E|nr:hypothetical protein [Sporosarcina thermotolerans]WHT49170.1 hypothetical protein QNH10_05965 [Sporosarcina thermotolerans]
MDEKLKGLEEKLDNVISQDDYFTELDKHRIRNGIKKMKSDAPAKRFNPLPAFLTAISICAFLVILGGIAGKEIGLFATEEPPQEINPPVSLPTEEAVDIENFIWNRYTIETGRRKFIIKTFMAIQSSGRGATKFQIQIPVHSTLICFSTI